MPDASVHALCDGGPLHPASRGPPPPMEEEKGTDGL